jgi:DNA-binding NtrC family response regulator
MKVLVVDEEAIDLFIATKLLEKEHEVFAFSMPAHAVTWSHDNDFEIVLVESSLQSGLPSDQFLKELQANCKCSFKPFILTNYVNEKNKELLRRAGFIDFITKPLTLDKFSSCMRTETYRTNWYDDTGILLL